MKLLATRITHEDIGEEIVYAFDEQFLKTEERAVLENINPDEADIERLRIESEKVDEFVQNQFD